MDIDADMGSVDVAKLRWYATRQTRTLAQQVRHILKEWLERNRAAFTEFDN